MQHDSYRLYLFDLDGTLISGYMDNPNREYDLWHVLPGRRERLEGLGFEGARVGIVTNQGGVAFGLVAEEQATAKINAALAALDLPSDTPVAVCFADARSHDPRYNEPSACARRKPSGAMIRELMAQLSVADPATVLFVGDRPEDEQAAADAGVAFRWAEEFFNV